MSGLLKAQTIFGAFRSLEHGDLEKNFFRHFKTLNIFNFDELRISLDFSRLLSAFWKLKYFRTSKKKIQTCIIQNIFRTFYDGFFFFLFFSSACRNKESFRNFQGLRTWNIFGPFELQNIFWQGLLDGTPGLKTWLD